MTRRGDPLLGPLKGEYDPGVIHFFAVNLIWKFQITVGLGKAIYHFLVLLRIAAM